MSNFSSCSKTNVMFVRCVWFSGQQGATSRLPSLSEHFSRLFVFDADRRIKRRLAIVSTKWEVAASSLRPASSSSPSSIFQQPYGTLEFLSLHHLWRLSLQTLAAVLVHVDVHFTQQRPDGLTHNGMVCVCVCVCVCMKGFVGYLAHNSFIKPFKMDGQKDTQTHTQTHTQIQSNTTCCQRSEGPQIKTRRVEVSFSGCFLRLHSENQSNLKLQSDSVTSALNTEIHHQCENRRVILSYCDQVHSPTLKWTD